jgi:hypothetical protein
MGSVQKFEWRCDGYQVVDPAHEIPGAAKLRCPRTEITADEQPPPGWNYVYTFTGRNPEHRSSKSRTVVCQDCGTRLRQAVSRAVRVGGWDGVNSPERAP